jgi:hypothetical protein
MKKLRIFSLVFLGTITALIQTQIFAFTAQLPISGYEFSGPIRIFNSDVGALTSVYTVPNNRIAVITDVYIALAGSATGTHTTFLANNSLTPIAGPFTINGSSAFSINYTSGLVWIEDQQIVVSDTGGTGDVIVNLVGYLVCRGSCD